jgi:hypothetical protein
VNTSVAYAPNVFISLMSVINMKHLTPGLKALTVPAEQREARVVGRKPIKLQYVKRSKQCFGFACWNLLAPQLPEYGTYGGDNGYPTFSLGTLKDKGLIA